MVLLLSPMKLLFLEENWGTLRFEKSQRKAQVALSWSKRDEKDYLKSERRMVKSAASHHEKRKARPL